MNVTLENKNEVAYQTPEFITFLREHKTTLMVVSEKRQKEFNDLVEAFSTHHKDYIVEGIEGPHSSSFEFKINLLKILHGVPTFVGLKELIVYVKHIPLVAIKRF